jgi:N-acetylmuramoyl-L-alanine amidase
MNAPKWKFKPTSNLHEGKRKGVKFIVLHHTGGSYPGDLNWLTTRGSKVSCDFYISKHGAIYKLNPQLAQHATWHAGVSEYGGYSDLNKWSIGIELEHKPGEAWTSAQMNACRELCAWLLERYGLRTNAVVGHKDIAMPRGRKTDPENFNFDRFRTSLQ